jgi:magnesium transporter
MVQRYALHSRRPAIGANAGELALPAEPTTRRIHVIHYTAERLEELDVVDVGELARFREAPGTTWIEVEGLGDEAGLRRLAELFGIHPLALADVVNVPQRPKTDAYEGHDLVIAWMARLGVPSECQLEQVSFVIGPSWVITFQEEREDVFDPVRTRLRGGAPIRNVGADYLAYALIDNLIDGYYPVIEAVGEELEELEEETVQRPTRATLARIHRTRRLILTLARTMRQHRDALNVLVRDESPRLSPGARVYFRDVYDHAVQINEVLESYREIAVSLMEVHLSSVSNRMNEVMKVLTVIATIFIPLTFLVGVYGMNFDYMPELRVRWAYPLLWVLMIAVALTMYVYFRRRGWVGREPDEGDGGPGDE